MTETEAQDWIAARFGTAKVARLAAFAERIMAETAHQNLIAASTVPHIWERHILDSAQLVPLAADAAPGDWIDIGSGAGFPGIVAAILTERRTILVEPRVRRARLLEAIAAELGLADVIVHQAKIERLASNRPAAVISARAVARLDSLFAIGLGHGSRDTLWVLPKGRGAADELAEARAQWRGTFHVEHSITDPASAIVIATGVHRA